jgi:sugar phosphate isomerase/epimerase
MKLSFSVALPEEDFQGNWQRKLKILADLGYPAVELGISRPEKINLFFLKSLLDKERLILSAIATGRAYSEDGLSLSTLQNALRAKAIERIKKHIDLASILGSQVIVGLVRGKIENGQVSKTKYLLRLFESIKTLCDYALPKKINLTIEPINRYETDFLNTVDETLTFIKRIKRPNLKILLDTYHMNIEEKDILESIEMAKVHLSHFHLADSNRRYPGSGHLDFKKIISKLKKINYRGCLSAEILLEPNFVYCSKKYFQQINRLV